MARVSPLLAVPFCALAAAASADEGMWTFDAPPTKALQEKYGVTPAQEWLDHVRLASVRFNDGGSGWFVSRDGLMITNRGGRSRWIRGPSWRRCGRCTTRARSSTS